MHLRSRSIYADGTTLTATNSSVLPTTSGGTGLTSFTSGGVVYASSTSALATGSGLNYASSTLTVNNILAASNGTNIINVDSPSQQIASFVSGVGYGTLNLNATPIIFQIAGTEGMRLTSTGLGIGTSSPATKLEVASANEAFRITGTNAYGTVTDGTVTTYLGGVTGGDVGGYTGTVSNHYYAIRTNNTERMRIANGGYVGIGTSSPIRPLQVGAYGSGDGEIAIASSTTGNGSILFGDGATGTDFYRGYIQYSHTTDVMLFATSSSERMRIASDGKVGIAVTDVRAVLQIGSGNGGGNVPTTSQLMFGANNSIVTFLGANDNISIDGVIGSWNTVYNHQNAKIEFYKAANTGELRFYTQAGAGITERFRIASNGAFGLSGANYGTSGQVLTSQGSGSPPIWAAGGGGSSQWTTSGSDIYYNTGNVAVKTTTFSSIAGTVGTLTLGGTNANTSGGIAYQTNGTVKGYHYIDFDNMTHQSISGGHLFLASNTEKMRITSAGNVGVGTSAPTSLLHTSGALCVGGTGGSGTNGTVTLTKINNGTFDVTMGLSGGNDPGLIEITAVQNDYSGASFGFLKAYYFVAQASVVTPATSSTATGTTFTVSFTNLTSTSYRVTVSPSRQQMSVSVTVLGARNIT